MNKNIETLSFWSLMAFGFVGAAFMSIALHEYSHYADLKDIVQTENICLQLPTSFKEIANFSRAGGYYEYSYEAEDKKLNQEIRQIKKTSEFKAYTLSILVLAMFIIMFYFSLKNRADAKFSEWKLNLEEFK